MYDRPPSFSKRSHPIKGLNSSDSTVIFTTVICQQLLNTSTQILPWTIFGSLANVYNWQWVVIQIAFNEVSPICIASALSTVMHALPDSTSIVTIVLLIVKSIIKGSIFLLYFWLMQP